MGIRINNPSLTAKTSYIDALGFKFIIDKTGEAEARVIDTKYFGNAIIQGKVLIGDSWHYNITNSDKYIRISTDGGTIWRDLGYSYTYIAYASDDNGTNFSLVNSILLPYMAILVSEVEIDTPIASDFTGLWRFSGEGNLHLDQTIPQSVINGSPVFEGIQFNTAPSTSNAAEGLLRWNPADGTLDLGMSGGNITLQIGQEMFIKVRNVSGTTISNGKPVYLSGRTGNRPNIYLAKGDVESTSKVVGMTTQDITSPSDGFITTMGYVRQIKTDYSGSGVWGTTWIEGDKLYVSKSVAGQLTNVEPTAPHHSDCIGTVGIVGNTGVGSILVNIQRHSTLQELSDVNGTPLSTDGQIPVWYNGLKVFDFNKNINDYLPIKAIVDTGGLTGFVDKDNITVSYNWTNRTITLTGTLTYYFRGTLKTLTSPWTSPAHNNTIEKWFLHSIDGNTFIWTNYAWDFSDVVIAFVNYKASALATFALRETHGTMDRDAHEELHQIQGTYVDPINGGGRATAGTYDINTATDVATTPGFDQAVIKDEDLRTTIPAWIQGTYTNMYVGAASSSMFSVVSSFPFTSTGSFMQVNDPLTGTMINGINNRFYNVYQILVPCTADANSQKYRMIMLQPQKEFTSQLSAESEDTSGLYFGDLANLTAEFKIYARLCYQTASGDANTGKCRLMSITYVSGTKNNSVNVGGIVPVINPAIIEFTTTDTPNIPDYTIYSALYTQYPTIKLFETDGSGNRVERTEKPYFTIVAGLITSVSFGTLPEPITGFILISKT